MRADLPAGGWVELRDVAEVPERLFRPVRLASFQLAKFRALRRSAAFQAQGQPVPADLEDAAAEEMAGGAAELMDRLTRLSILARVTDWSFGPVTEEQLDELPTAAYSALARLVDEEPVPEELNEPSQDIESPTPPSTD